MANNQIAEAPALAPEPNQINQDQGEIPEIRTVPGGLTMGMIANTVVIFGKRKRTGVLRKNRTARSIRQLGSSDHR